jgi:hypothetical protein
VWIERFQTRECREISAGVSGRWWNTLADIDARIGENDAAIGVDFRERVVDVRQILRGQISDAGSFALHIPDAK